MKNKKLLLLPFLALLLAGCKPSSSSSTPPDSSGPDSSQPGTTDSSEPGTEPTETLPSIPVEETPKRTIAEIRAMTADGASASAAQKELVYETKGVVTAKFRGAVLDKQPAWNIAIQDGADALLLYAISEETYAADFAAVKVGDELTVEGNLAAHNGLRELGKVKYVSHKAATAVTPLSLTSIKQADLKGKDSVLVKIDGLKVLDKPTLVAEMGKDSEGKDRTNITVGLKLALPSDLASTLSTYMHYNITLADAKATVAKLSAVKSTDTISWTGVLGMNGGVFQLTNANADEWTVTPGAAVELASIGFSVKSRTLEWDGKYQTILEKAPWDGPLTGLVYASANEAVATVDQEGLVTAVGAGTTNVTATVGDKVATVAITVKEKPEVPQFVVSSFNFENFDYNSWVYSITKVVDGNGLEYAVKEGRVDFDASDSISATTERNGVKVLRFRGADTAYLESPVFESVTTVTFDAKYYNGSHTAAVMKVSYKAAADAEWTVAENITLTAEYVEQVVAINKENVAVRIDATGKTSNIDNLVIKGYSEVEPVEPVEPDLMTIETARSKVGEEVVTYGVITGIAKSSSNPSFDNHMLVTIQHGDYAIQTYNLKDALVADLKVGDYVQVAGKVADYNGLIQLNPASAIEKLEGTAPEITPFEVVTFTAEALEGMSSRLVSVKGLTYKSGTVVAEGNSADSQIKFMFGETEVTLQISKHFDSADRLALKTLIEGLEAGDTVDFTGPLGWYKAPQLNGMNASMLTVHKAA